MVTAESTLEELRALGTEQNRKVYKRHGAGDNIFGVSYANFNRLAKRIKVDQSLAVRLWQSGNEDARVLALMVGDPQRVDEDTIEAWASDVQHYGLADALAGFVAKTRFARAKAEEWSRSAEEWRGTSGWDLIGSLALNDHSLPDDYFHPYLERIERDLHASANRVRYAMNTALISIGMRSDALEARALAVAMHIGKVEVDHGQTGCKTPDAASYIARAKARRKK